ncbi:Phosphatidyl-myo-inositol mannosyltransferase [Pontiella desulfatans]|uniref:Phosphatidyl-myo-inositol mannosyltransferase n=1 Tax=Pontiella desulfatans TaxID=2750659 RepID=A0A6C2TWT7_PONDE|nr:glycosyltransferase family 4 protein [Pontiella desulfatans]VGO12155.1 Phosphatidyl-myo-inositol mannosyltransferase [Pontiella desulfatans]
MKVLVIHNEYGQKGGGEHQVFMAETELLRRHGHEVLTYAQSNLDVLERGRLATIKMLFQSRFNRTVYHELRRLCEIEKPDVVHVHNFWFSISPSVYAACLDSGVPVVQSLHNFRTICVNALLLRDGKPCEDCVGRTALKGVLKRCYHGSRIHGWFVYRMQRGFRKLINVPAYYLALTEHSRDIFVRSGFPSDRVWVKNNFVADHFAGITNLPSKPRALFIGSLMTHKGIRTLLDAWGRIPDIELVVVGDGELKDGLMELCRSKDLTHIEFRGYLNPAEVMKEIRQCSFLVVPSEWYETFGLIVVEAFSAGKPVVAANIGALGRLVEDGVNGLLFNPGDATDLIRCVGLMRDEVLAKSMGECARKCYQQRYSENVGYRNLIEVYEKATLQGGS